MYVFAVIKMSVEIVFHKQLELEAEWPQLHDLSPSRIIVLYLSYTPRHLGVIPEAEDCVWTGVRPSMMETNILLGLV